MLRRTSGSQPGWRWPASSMARRARRLGTPPEDDEVGAWKAQAATRRCDLATKREREPMRTLHFGTINELTAQGIDADVPSSPDGSDDFRTTLVVDPDGNRTKWSSGRPATPTAPRRPTGRSRAVRAAAARAPHEPARGRTPARPSAACFGGHVDPGLSSGPSTWVCADTLAAISARACSCKVMRPTMLPK